MSLKGLLSLTHPEKISTIYMTMMRKINKPLINGLFIFLIIVIYMVEIFSGWVKERS